ncbi:FecCD family ABC transporter permease [Actinokineospora sp.]|uniref:FecCD family ABC transporter permease n=1 Tax=Actinokineospora sp. TaxID=1872133 RepID=UPI003D6C2FAB
MALVELTRQPGRIAVRLGPTSAIIRPRMLGVCLGLLLASALLFAVELSFGDYPIPLPDVVQALFGVGDRATLFVIEELRLPRALVGLLAGCAFGVSGALFQTLTRNPLASPDMIGLSAGSATAVVAGIVLGFGSGLGTQALGLLGGIATAVLIYGLAWKGGTTGYRIVLVGIGVSWMCTSLTSYLLVKADMWQAQQVLRWIIGSLNGADWVHVTPLAWATVTLGIAVLLLSRWLRLLQLGTDVATALGVPVRFAQPALIVTAAALVSFATAATGPIVFVALTAPQIAQRLTGSAWPPLVASGLTGSFLVLGSDLIAQRVIPGTLLPIGVVTGALGGLFLLWLLTRANRVGSGG